MSYSPPVPAKLLSVEEGRRIIGVGRTTLYALVAEGRLRLVKIGRRSFLVAAELEAFVASLHSLNGRRGGDL
jgi:excisionase family DNA binding protein